MANEQFEKTPLEKVQLAQARAMLERVLFLQVRTEMAFKPEK